MPVLMIRYQVADEGVGFDVLGTYRFLGSSGFVS